jgi:hypothetical protein
MQAIERSLSAVSVGAVQRHRNLAVFPLISGEAAAPGYSMLDEALGSGRAFVRELTEGGSVPELAFENTGADPVLLVDGEELRGARQNRILNISILVGAGRKLVIPVSCVERGRWSYTSRHFDASERMLFAKARSSKALAVSESMRAGGPARADQGRIWAEIDERFAAADQSSETAAMADLYESEGARLAAYERAFEWQPGQAGAVFAIDGRPVAVELFDSPDTFRKFLKKAVGSFAMDAVAARRPVEKAPAKKKVEAFLGSVKAAAVERFPAAGEGEDLRLSGSGLAGGALEAQGRVVHLSVFRVDG